MQTPLSHIKSLIIAIVIPKPIANNIIKYTSTLTETPTILCIK